MYLNQNLSQNTFSKIKSQKYSRNQEENRLQSGGLHSDFRHHRRLLQTHGTSDYTRPWSWAHVRGTPTQTWVPTTTSLLLWLWCKPASDESLTRHLLNVAECREETSQCLWVFQMLRRDGRAAYSILLYILHSVCNKYEIDFLTIREKVSRGDIRLEIAKVMLEWSIRSLVTRRPYWDVWPAWKLTRDR